MEPLDNISKEWDKWKYKYLSATLVSLIIAVFIAKDETFKHFLYGLGTLEYIGAFIAGILFVTGVTIPISFVLLALIAENLNPLLIGLIGGVGAMIGDYIIFKLVRDHLSEELAILVGKDNTTYAKHLIRSKYVTWMLPLIGVLIIASPLPDELGVSLLGASRISTANFLLISYVSNALGILAVASVAKVF